MRANDLNFPFPVLGMPGVMQGDPPKVAYTSYIPDKNLIQVPYRWVFDIDIKNQCIIDLIQAGKAQYMCEVTCSATLMRKCIFSSTPKIEVVLGRREVNKRVEFSLYVVAKEHIADYDNDAANEDYRELAPFDIDVGSPLAVLSSYRWDADLCYEDLTSLRSILQVLKNTSDPAQQFVTLSLEHEYIQILLPAQQYDAFMEKSQTDAFAEVIKSSLIMYALQAALSQVSPELTHRWERAVDTYIKQDSKFEGLSLENKGDVPIIAAKMLGNPFKQLAETLPKLAVLSPESSEASGDEDEENE